MQYLMGSHASRQGGRGSGNDARGRVLDQWEFMDGLDQKEELL